MVDDANRRFGHYEKAARRYCELAGIDADQTIGHGYAEFSDSGPGFYPGGILYTAQWLFIARNLDDHKKRHDKEAMMDVALKEYPTTP